MQIINDFFLLIWGKRYEDEKKIAHEVDDKILTKELLSDFENLCDACAIVFSINPHNSPRIFCLPMLEQVMSLLGATFIASEKEIQKVQEKLLLDMILLGSLKFNQAIIKRLERLLQEEIISYDHLRAISGLIQLIPEKKVEVKTMMMKEASHQENYYKTAIHSLQIAIENLSLVIEKTQSQERLHAVLERLLHQHFSIGITGVMNAGKSTLLNALLGKEILGTSVVPETANLTLIKYAKNPYAQVNFWNAKEWRRIEEGAQTLKSLEIFVKESKEHFGKAFDTMVTAQGRSETIAVEDLASYTSAKYSDKKCNLVKSVELYTDLKFVQEGVQIVDTPGLDDPVVQREEITREYLSECDLMVHLMNAAQAATQKDIDFIIDALVYQNVAQLLVLITRIDVIGQKELDEVITYTQKSIEARLKEQNKGSKLDEVIAKIVFIPIAGKLALMHRLHQEKEALALGYTLERTGLPKFEAYLEEILFGANSQKAQLIIASNQKEIEAIATETRNLFEQERHFLTLSSEELEQTYTNYQQEKKSLMAFLEQMHVHIQQYKAQMQDYFLTLEKFALSRLDALQNVLKRRLMDDVTYEMAKHKKLPKQERINSIIETTMKDGMVDLVRDYRYEFQKKMQSIFEYIQAQYSEFQGTVFIEELDIRAFCEEHLGALLVFKNTTILLANVNEAISQYAKEESKLSLALESLLKKEFYMIQEVIEPKLAKINHELLDSFMHSCEAPINALKDRSKAKEDLLEEAIVNMKNISINQEERLAQIQEKERIIGLVLDDLQKLKEQ